MPVLIRESKEASSNPWSVTLIQNFFSHTNDADHSSSARKSGRFNETASRYRAQMALGCPCTKAKWWMATIIDTDRLVSEGAIAAIACYQTRRWPTTQTLTTSQCHISGSQSKRFAPGRRSEVSLKIG